MNTPITISRKRNANLIILSGTFEKAATILSEYLKKITEALYALISLKRGTSSDLLHYITEFAATARQTGLEMVEEWKITVDMFITDSLAALKEDEINMQ